MLPHDLVAEFHGIVTEFMSPDGVIDSPGGGDHPWTGWSFKEVDFDPAAYEIKAREQQEAGAFLMGRVSYEEFSPVWPGMTEDFADYNAMPKYAVSTTINETDPAWQAAVHRRPQHRPQSAWTSPSTPATATASHSLFTTCATDLVRAIFAQRTQDLRRGKDAVGAVLSNDPVTQTRLLRHWDAGRKPCTIQNELRKVRAGPMSFDDNWDVEERFWLDGPEFYEEWLAPDARMIFPEPVGILKGEEILAGLKQAPRWQSVDFQARTQTRSGDTVVLAYKATAERKDSKPYTALCSSTYVRDGDTWKLLSHQQTPGL